MTKILTTKQIKSLDAYTIAHEPITSIDLMERACKAFTAWFTDRFPASNKVGIVCGTGNNGGDGLGIARLLKARGYSVNIWIVRGTMSTSEDFKNNFARLSGLNIPVQEISSAPNHGLFVNCDILIDAILGTGLSRKPEGIYAQAIGCFNKADAIKVSVDIPSGLMADSHSEGPIASANHTITFALPKLSFLLPSYHQFTGEWQIVDIGLSRQFIRDADTHHFFVTKEDVRGLIKPRSRFAHKGNFGHALMVAGSHGKIGAAVLASRAALRSGLGLLTIHTPQCGYEILQTTVPEAMTEPDEHELHLTHCATIDHYDVIGIGPGLGQHEQTTEVFVNILKQSRGRVVIDADGLNILAQLTDRSIVPEGSILTPHVKEFKRLVGDWDNDFQRLEKQTALAKELKSVVIVKGAFTTIATAEGKFYFNETGNPGMATGGTGDVLTGVLTGLLAQGYSSLDASLIGVYAHGLAGDIAAEVKGMMSLIASDVIDALPEAFKSMTRG